MYLIELPFVGRNGYGPNWSWAEMVIKCHTFFCILYSTEFMSKCAVEYHEISDLSGASGLDGGVHLSRDMRFPTMWHVRPAKTQTSLRIRAV